LLVLSHAVSGETTASNQEDFTLLTETDVGGNIDSIFIKDVNNDGSSEIITDSVLTTSFGKSGIVYSLDYNGGVLWRNHAGLLEDLYVSDNGAIVAGTGGHVSYLNPDGTERWQRSSRSSVMQKIYGQSVYSADLDGDKADEVVSATNYGMRGSELKVWGSQGDSQASFDFKGNRFPAVLDSADLDGDGRQEILAGVVLYSPNTVAGTISPAYSKPGIVQAMDLDGNVLWSYETPKGVSAIETADLDGDGKPEVLVGIEGRLTAYHPDGRQMWDTEVSGIVTRILVSDLHGNGTKRIIVGAGMLSALNTKGMAVWRYNSGTVYDVAVTDLNGDGRLEVVSAGQELRIVDSEGKLLWKSQRYGKLRAVAAEDMIKDGYPEIVAGGDDSKIMVFSTERYGKGLNADYYYNLADRQFKARQFNESKYSAMKAKDYYAWLGDEAAAARSQTLVEKNTLYVGAEGYYALAKEYMNNGDPESAAYYAEKALEEFRKVQDLRMLGEVNTLLTKGKMSPKADDSMNISKYYYGQGMWENASFYAAKAREQYSYLGDVKSMDEADIIANNANKQLKALEYIMLANNHSIFGEYENATQYLIYANRTYAELNDTQGVMAMSARIAEIDGMMGRSSVIKYGGLIAILITLALSAFIGLLTVRILVKHVFKHNVGDFTDMFTWLRWKPSDGGKTKKKVQNNERRNGGGGLRGI
ncbi:MAG: hypothetical protein ABIH11_04690, partial [Candidatus Altiarchaeota archaeon]